MNGAGASALPGVAAPDPRVLREVDCGLCGSQRKRERFASPPYRIVECQDCGLVYVTPRRDEGTLRELYLEHYWRSPEAKSFGYTDYLRDEPLYLKTYRRRFAEVRARAPRPGRVLDVGCAAGFFLAIAKENGWACTGVEPSAAMARFARERYGLEVREGSLEEQRFPAGAFDLVTFWDVIEHVPDPVAALREARRVLAPGGLLLLETQNVASAFARLMGHRWHHYKHAEHIYHFDPRTIAECLRRAGFEPIGRRASLGGKYVSLDFVAERSHRLHPLAAKLLAPLRALGRRSFYVNLFDEMIVVARPREGAGT